jgi:hypothetical protein
MAKAALKMLTAVGIKANGRMANLMDAAKCSRLRENYSKAIGIKVNSKKLVLCLEEPKHFYLAHLSTQKNQHRRMTTNEIIRLIMQRII